MDTIDVSDLPEPIARQIQAMVQALREQLRSEKPEKRRVTLPVWRGSVKGPLTRDEIYDDVG